MTERDYWTPDGSFFICDGRKYGVTPNGGIACLGEAQDTANKPSALQRVVLQQPIKGNVKGASSQTVVMQQKHAGGRPIKDSAVHRTTAWRRQQKEKQGLLL